ncbi:uncharacterized protein LOC116141274 [Pistacia vera]|uniref:uncharacterized protein LOC116141274 n=1 Tax=Pistacia vera TaxID=55513 RepID=UPI001262DDD0|nr:uncharacterized protein LOC116141274 [Pistacia vera]
MEPGIRSSDLQSEATMEPDSVRTGENIRNGDPLFLQNSNHPGMILVSTPLMDKNYLSWSRSMKLALGAKVKLGFTNGQCKIPDESSPTFDQWRRVAYMVTFWILNSNSREIVKAFLYTTSAKDLWKELEERFGECNGPLLYQIQRDISSINQGNMPFLMGLNDSFDHVRNQILVMDPLPTINKAYSMILRVEKQREVHVAFADNLENSAMFAKAQGVKTGYKRKDTIKKSERHCDFCNNNRHTKETCFKLHGYPDWYKDLKEQKGKTQHKSYANMTDTPLEAGKELGNTGTEWGTTISELIQ